MASRSATNGSSDAACTIVVTVDRRLAMLRKGNVATGNVVFLARQVEARLAQLLQKLLSE